MKKTGFLVAKKLALQCLQNGNFQHEQRNDINIKNLLATGEVDADSIAKVIGKSKGINHESSHHHHDSGTEVHIIKRDGWYIKFYFIEIEPDNLTVFISVHR
jgi:hypothetical protein